MSGAPVRVGAIVGRALSEFGRTSAWTLALAALAFGVSWTLDEAIGAARLRRVHVDDVIVPAAWLAGIVVELAAATSMALSRLRGERTPVVAAIGTAARRVLPVAAACALSVAGVLAGLAALVIPGLVALGALGLALPVAVDERCGPWRAVVRSAAVTRGHRGRVLVSLGALCAVSLVLAAVVVGVCVASDASVFAVVVGVTWVAALPAVGAAVAYHTIRATNEAPREAELERVFG